MALALELEKQAVARTLLLAAAGRAHLRSRGPSSATLLASKCWTDEQAVECHRLEPQAHARIRKEVGRVAAKAPTDAEAEFNVGREQVMHADEGAASADAGDGRAVDLLRLPSKTTG